MSQNMQVKMLDQWRWQAYNCRMAIATIALLLFMTCFSELSPSARHLCWL